MRTVHDVMPARDGISFHDLDEIRFGMNAAVAIGAAINAAVGQDVRITVGEFVETLHKHGYEIVATKDCG